MRHRILIVDDNESVRATLRFVLMKSGYAARTADGGENALALVRAQRVHGAIVDLHMPRMNGIEVMRALHSSQPGLPVWLITAVATRETEQRARQAGALGVLPKPFRLEPLLAGLELHVRGQLVLATGEPDLFTAAA